MHRIKKLIGILFILGIVFFIICDEKGIKIGLQDGKLVFNEIEEQKPIINEKTINSNVVYKNSDLIHINYEFKNPKLLRKSDGIDPNLKGPTIYKNSTRIKLYSGFENVDLMRNSLGVDSESLAKTETEKLNQKSSGPNIISLNDEDIVSIFNVDKASESDIQKDEEIDLDEENYEIEDLDTPEIIYKNSTRIKLYTGFENPIILCKGDYIYPVEVDIEKNDIIENNIVENNSIEELDDTSEDVNEVIFKPLNSDEDENVGQAEDIEEPKDKQEILQLDQEEELKEIEKNITENKDADEVLEKENAAEKEETAELIKQEKEAEFYRMIGKYIRNNVKDILRTAEKIEVITEEIVENENGQEIEDLGETEEILTIETEENKEIEENITENKDADEVLEKENATEKEETAELIKQEKEAEFYKMIGKYIRNNVRDVLRRAESIQHNFVIDEESEVENGDEIEDSNQLLNQLLINEEIDLDSLESENDEFLLKVFQKTKDEKIMNLIVENYLNEYQFINAKKFIENLPEDYASKVKPSLNLRVAFNSFPLTSKNISESLKTTVQNYLSKGEILDEDANRYLGVIALMNHNYDYYFDIASGFTSEKYVSFTAKLQGYKDQISKQMGMPDYYFDTLVALELFNQGLFQPAKVVSLSSLQKNTNYILPYQVLAYANFLTNSRDTSIEYLKKLVDLDPNNAEKYRFLMGVAYYRDEKYEQSILMLSMIKDEKLRLDTQRYLIKDYLKINQKNKLISIRNKLLGYENLVASDFYTYFYEAFYHPFSEGLPYQIYAYDIELANKMIRVCSMKLSDEEKVVCNYGMIGKNIASGQFDGLEESLLKLATDYPQGYLYQALGEYYIQQGDTEKAKAYLLKAVSLTKRTPEVVQIKKLLQETM